MTAADCQATTLWRKAWKRQANFAGGCRNTGPPARNKWRPPTAEGRNTKVRKQTSIPLQENRGLLLRIEAISGVLYSVPESSFAKKVIQPYTKHAEISHSMDICCRICKKRHNSTKISSQESEKALRQNEKNKAEMAANLSTNVTKRHTVYGFLMNCMVRYTSNSTTESAQSTAFKRPKREGKRSFPGQKKPYKIRSPAREQGPAGAGRILSQADANSRTAAEKKCFSSQTAF